MNNFSEIVNRFVFSVPDEVDASLPLVSGAVPPELSGTLMRNGPGRLQRGGQTYGHPFDGDGMLSWFVFDRGSVRYRNRFVRTREYIAESRAGRLLYRGFGTNLPGGVLRNAGRLRFKNAANTSVIAHGGRVLALWEGGWPHEIDPASGQTRQRFNYSGGLNNQRTIVDRWVNPELPFSAHPRIDSQTGELFNFGMAFGPQNRLMLYCVGADGVLLPPRSLPLPELTFVHDFITTDRWLVFLMPAVSFRVGRALLGLSTPVTSLRVDPGKPMRAVAIEKAAVRGEVPLRPRWFDLDRGGFVFHVEDALMNEGDSRLSFSGMWLRSFPDVADFSTLFTEGENGSAVSKPVRFDLDFKTGRGSTRQLSDVGCELPVRLPDGGLVASACPPGRQQPFYSALARIDTQHAGKEAVMPRVSWRDFGPRLIGEPMVTDQGWLLSLVGDAASDSTELWIIDPITLDPVAQLRLPHRQPPGLHGRWLDAETTAAYGVKTGNIEMWQPDSPTRHPMQASQQPQGAYS